MMESQQDSLKKILAIPDLSLVKVSRIGDFIIVNSNRETMHHMYMISMTSPGVLKDITPISERVVTCALSNDENKIVFPKENAGNEKHDLYITDLNAENVELLLKLDSFRVLSVHWSQDDKFILFDGSTQNSMGIWQYDVRNGDLVACYETRQLGSMRAGVNPARPFISWVEQRPENPRASLIKVINYQTREVEKILDVSPSSNDIPMAWNDDGNKLLVQTDALGNPSLAVWDMNDDSLSYLKATEMELGIEYIDAKWIPGSDDIVYVAKKNGNTRIFLESLHDDSLPREFPLEEGTTSNIHVVKEFPSILYLTWSNLSCPPRIIRYDMATQQSEVIIDSRPKHLDLHFSKGKFLTYSSIDGRRIPAFLIEPVPGDQLPGSPSIILVHGGPTWEIANDWNTMAPIIQLYVAAGFRVLCPNFRGSTGYGSEFRDLNIGDLGGGDLNDIIAAREFLSKTYPHSQCHFITGASYGGYMTFIALVKHPGKFTAGAAIVGITDWIAMHEMGDQLFKKFTERFFQGPPEEKIELYKDRSPITFVDHLKDPLLVIHRENDSRCPLTPVQTFVNEARRLGKHVEFYVERDAGHGHQRIDHLQNQYLKVVEFFLRHLRSS